MFFYLCSVLSVVLFLRFSFFFGGGGEDGGLRQACTATWKALNPDYEVRVLDNAEVSELLSLEEPAAPRAAGVYMSWTWLLLGNMFFFFFCIFGLHVRGLHVRGLHGLFFFCTYVSWLLLGNMLHFWLFVV